MGDGIKRFLLPLTLLALLTGYGCSDEEQTVRHRYGQRTAAEIRGEESFHRHCAHCHGQNGSGGRMTEPLRHKKFRFGASQEELVRTITDGLPPGMPAFGGTLPQQELEALAAYIRWLQ